jgi:hypothetical protein
VKNITVHEAGSASGSTHQSQRFRNGRNRKGADECRNHDGHPGTIPDGRLRTCSASLAISLESRAQSHLTPLPIDEDASSLSAILLDNDYYGFIRSGRQEIDGIPMVGVPQLIALKARAWLDLTERAKRGEQMDSKTIKKHKNDVFRLYQILDPASDPTVPEAIKKDMHEFISRMQAEDIDLKSLGLRTGTRDGILTEIAKVYRLAERE